MWATDHAFADISNRPTRHATFSQTFARHTRPISGATKVTPTSRRQEADTMRIDSLPIPEHLQLSNSVRAFTRKEVSDYVRAIDRQTREWRDHFSRMRSLGQFGTATTSKNVADLASRPLVQERRAATRARSPTHRAVRSSRFCSSDPLALTNHTQSTCPILRPDASNLETLTHSTATQHVG